MNTNEKEELINALIIRLADKTGTSIDELKSEISMTLYSYSVTKIDNTELIAGDRSSTDYLLQYYAIGKLSANMSPSTVKRVTETVYQLCDFTHKELNTIEPEDVKMFLFTNQHNGNWADVTAENKRHYLNSVFSYLTIHKKIAENPMELVDKIKCEIKIKEALTDAQIERIKLACEGDTKLDHRNLAIVNFLIDTGCRVGELVNIKLSDIDFTTREVIIRKTKNRKERKVMFSERTMVRLEKYFIDRPEIKFEGFTMKSSDAYLFTTVRGNTQLSRHSVEALISKIGDKVGIPWLTPHTFRRTTATQCFKHGVSSFTVQKYLGHSNSGSIDRYINTDTLDTMRNVL